MKNILLALLLTFSFAVAANAGESRAEKIMLKDGSTLFLHPDGTSRMVNHHGKAMAMADGIEMESMDGDIVMMMNKKVWMKYGTGKGRRGLKPE